MQPGGTAGDAGFCVEEPGSGGAGEHSPLHPSTSAPLHGEARANAEVGGLEHLGNRLDLGSGNVGGGHGNVHGSCFYLSGSCWLMTRAGTPAAVA
jgi:hypothetical protein